jgi:hypothetical protein
VQKTASSNSSRSPDEGIGARVAKAIVKRLQDGESPKAVAASLDVSYMAVYKIGTGKTWKTLTGGLRVIPERKPRIRIKHRRWVTRAREAGKSKAFIARKLNVTETTASRLVADSDMVQSFRLRNAVLTAGSELAAAKSLGISLKRAEELMLIEVPSELPRRLRDLIEE